MKWNLVFHRPRPVEFAAAYEVRSYFTGLFQQAAYFTGQALVDPGAIVGARMRVAEPTTGHVASLPENSITTRHILFEGLFCP
jgi:hypothetical protein